ncbi:MAG: hypothetical protein LUC23_02360 [Prevotellaceae bacterium]|nr:hypothetical protein [Prevotellaceae bacterium]
MSVKYKLIRRKDPRLPDSTEKWYATPITGSPQSIRTMSKLSTLNTTLSPMELETAINLFGEYAVQQLRAGNSVRVGGLGTLRVIFKSDGVENIDDFKANAMIKNVRVLFSSSHSFREVALKNLSFTNGGVLEEGVNYASLSAYRHAKGLAGGKTEEDTPEQEETPETGGSDWGTHTGSTNTDNPSA